MTADRRTYPPLRPLTTAEQLLVADNLGLCGQVAWRYAVALVESHGVYLRTNAYRRQFFDEMIDACWLGLCVAAQRYDPANVSGAKFGSFAYHLIRSMASRHADEAELRWGTNKTTRRNRVIAFSDCRTRAVGANGGENEGQLDVWDSREEYEEVPTVLRAELLVLMSLVLDERQADVVRQYVIDGRTLNEIGIDYGISRERVRQIVEKSLGILRESKPFMHALERQVYRAKGVVAHEFAGAGVGVLIA